MWIKNNFLAGLLCGLIIAGSGMLAENNFVVKKKQDKEKKRSASHMREDCIVSTVTMLSQTPDLLILIGQIQNILLEIMMQVHDGAWMTSAIKSDLEKELARCAECTDSLDRVTAQLYQCLKILTEQKEKYSVKKS